MLVLLPPSEGKTSPGTGVPLDLTELSNSELNPNREQVLDSLIRLCNRTPRKALTTLGLSRTQQTEVTANAMLADAPTAPAWQVYTGVLFGALDFGSLSAAARNRAARRLLITSSLFGIVGPNDQIPAYRLSGDVTLPRIGKVDHFWRAHLGAVLGTKLGGALDDELLVDMRSGTYVKFWPVPAQLAPRAVTVKVWQPGPNGTRNAVSHFNKASKGELARILVATTSAPTTPKQLVDFCRDHGWDAQLEPDTRLGHDRLDVTIDP